MPRRAVGGGPLLDLRCWLGTIGIGGGTVGKFGITPRELAALGVVVACEFAGSKPIYIDRELDMEG